MEKKGYLLLADGQLYEGVLRGAVKVMEEVVAAFEREEPNDATL